MFPDTRGDIKSERNILLEFIRTFWKRRRAFMIFYSSLLVLALLYSFLSPTWYMARVIFLVEPEVPTIPMTSIVITTPFKVSSVVKSHPSRYINMLRSRVIMDAVIDEFDLEEVYGIDVREELYDKLQDDIVIIDNMDRSVTILCLFKSDPADAARMANALYRHLEELDERLNRQRAAEYRVYMERSHRDAQEELRRAEEDLKEYQDNTGIVALEEQTQKIIALAAKLESERIASELERDYLKRTVEGAHPRLSELSERIKALEEKIETVTEDSLSTLIALGKLPDRSLEYARLFREVSLREMVVEYLTTQVEQAKIDERKKSTNLLILEEAAPPERPARPRLLQIMALTIFFGFFLSIFFIQMLEFRDENRKELKDIIDGTDHSRS